jgi:hypothetical protein
MKTAKQLIQMGMLVVFTGCVTLYKPNIIHSPMLIEKGDLNLSASLGLSGSGLYNLQASYAISNHGGMLIDGMYHSRHINSSNSAVDNLNMVFGEAGAGYFTRFGSHANSIFQCYSGAGFGYTSDKMENATQPSPEVNSKYINVFIQPGMFYHNEYFDLAFDIRTNYVRLYNIHGDLYDQFEWWNTDFEFYSDTTLDFVNIEPAVSFKVGGKRLKGIVQLGITIPAVNSNSYFRVNTASMLIGPLIKFSMGIAYSFGKK